MLREKPEDEDPKRTADVGPIQGYVSFEGVTFAYDPGKPVLHEISFEARPGTATALVGPSGSGKSTIISLIAAFHPATLAALARAKGAAFSAAHGTGDRFACSPAVPAARTGSSGGHVHLLPIRFGRAVKSLR